MADSKFYSAGQATQDLCRVCKDVRSHRVFVTDGDGQILKVQCDYCGSLHRFRNGGVPVGRKVQKEPAPIRPAAIDRPKPSPVVEAIREEPKETTEIFDPEELDIMDMERLLRRVIQEELAISPVELSKKWRGGTLVFKPGNPDLQAKEVPIETFLTKVVAVRNRLRVLEQQVNKSDLETDEKIKLQGYITAIYGSLTTFNVFFANSSDQFRGAGG